MGVMALPIVANWPRGWIVGPDGLSGASQDPGGQQGDEFDGPLMLRKKVRSNGVEKMKGSGKRNISSASKGAKDTESLTTT